MMQHNGVQRCLRARHLQHHHITSRDAGIGVAGYHAMRGLSASTHLAEPLVLDIISARVQRPRTRRCTPEHMWTCELNCDTCRCTARKSVVRAAAGLRAILQPSRMQLRSFVTRSICPAVTRPDSQISEPNIVDIGICCRAWVGEQGCVRGGARRSASRCSPDSCLMLARFPASKGRT